MRRIIGIDRRIKRVWLDAMLDRVADTTKEADLRLFVDELLREELPGNASRANTSGIILRIWGDIPLGRCPLRDRAIALLSQISRRERIWLHWGMTALAYPFFRDTAEVVGRLLTIQNDLRTAQVYSRLVPTWGDRETSKEATQKLLRTLVEWGALSATETKGRFLPGQKVTTNSADLQLWLLEALLNSQDAPEIEAQQLLRLPEAFSFTLSVGVGDLRRHDGFDIHRQGLDMDMVVARSKSPPVPHV